MTVILLGEEKHLLLVGKYQLGCGNTFLSALLVFGQWGISLWLHPKAVFRGFKKGLNDIGIIDLKISKPDLMKMDFNKLVEITAKDKTSDMGFLQWSQFIFWIAVSQIIFLFHWQFQQLYLFGF